MIRTFKRYYADTVNTRTGKNNGRLISVWKHYEDIRAVPLMEVYANHCAPGEIKGPHLHKTRWDYFTCVRGKIVTVVKDGDEYVEFISSEDEPLTIEVPANVPSAQINLYDGVSVIVNLCNPAWHPENEDNYNVEFPDYDFSKWKTEQ